MTHPRPPAETHLDWLYGKWVLRDDWSLAVDDGNTFINIPAGFTFDLSSVPRPVWGILSNSDLGIDAPLTHDWLYQHGGRPPGTVPPTRTFTRAEADYLFYALATIDGVPRWRRVIAYLAVRLFGFWAWQRA